MVELGYDVFFGGIACVAVLLVAVLCVALWPLLLAILALALIGLVSPAAMYAMALAALICWPIVALIRRPDRRRAGRLQWQRRRLRPQAGRPRP